MKSDDKKRLVDYLCEYCKNGKKYVRARYIAKDVGLSTKQIGIYLGQFKQMAPIIDGQKLFVDKYAYTSCTTWVVSIRNI